jgi:hypothetical protein
MVSSDLISDKALKRLTAIARGEAVELEEPAHPALEANIETAPAEAVSS